MTEDNKKIKMVMKKTKRRKEGARDNEKEKMMMME
jgi:hypothetical protein